MTSKILKTIIGIFLLYQLLAVFMGLILWALRSLGVNYYYTTNTLADWHPFVVGYLMVIIIIPAVALVGLIGTYITHTFLD